MKHTPLPAAANSQPQPQLAGRRHQWLVGLSVGLATGLVAGAICGFSWARVNASSPQPRPLESLSHPHGAHQQVRKRAVVAAAANGNSGDSRGHTRDSGSGSGGDTEASDDDGGGVDDFRGTRVIIRDDEACSSGSDRGSRQRQQQPARRAHAARRSRCRRDHADDDDLIIDLFGGRRVAPPVRREPLARQKDGWAPEAVAAADLLGSSDEELVRGGPDVYYGAGFSSDSSGSSYSCSESGGGGDGDGNGCVGLIASKINGGRQSGRRCRRHRVARDADLPRAVCMRNTQRSRPCEVALREGSTVFVLATDDNDADDDAVPRATSDHHHHHHRRSSSDAASVAAAEGGLWTVIDPVTRQMGMAPADALHLLVTAPAPALPTTKQRDDPFRACKHPGPEGCEHDVARRLVLEGGGTDNDGPCRVSEHM
jgi:hypothetical protein